MAGLTAPADNHTSEGRVIEADGWFPGIDTAAIRAAIRLGDGAIGDERLAAAIEGGIIAGLRALSAWRSARAAEGIPDLADVAPEDQVNGKPRAVLIWQRIVGFYTAAELADTHLDVSATDEALDRDSEKRDAADDYRRKAFEAVADLQGIGLAEGAPAPGRNRVALI
ncbi:head completion/stabilization protein [Qipengyuania citrea]|uniref:head completion/stabilization protein n=1 Tax=Qipengyuania citrea TaxID=225971 RepID=UPI00209D05DF|nr:head completion/stabilization protein [Qipengyuania citrea]MCP2016832.1 hypothetical protein [Qipengyuania citrea]